MRTPITLEEFLFTLAQIEDMRVSIIDYMAEENDTIYEGWKSDIWKRHKEHNPYMNWFVQYFSFISGGLEIVIVKSKEELD